MTIRFKKWVKIVVSIISTSFILFSLNGILNNGIEDGYLAGYIILLFFSTLCIIYIFSKKFVIDENCLIQMSLLNKKRIDFKEINKIEVDHGYCKVYSNRKQIVVTTDMESNFEFIEKLIDLTRKSRPDVVVEKVKLIW